MDTFLVLAQAGSGSSTQAMLAAIFPFILMFVVLYFLMIRPQKKKENERKKLIEAIKKGDRVVTLGGIFGKVVSAKDDELIIQIDPAKDVCVKFTRSAVSRVIEPEKRAD